MQGSVEAIDKVYENIAKPMSATGVTPPKGGAPPDMDVATGVAAMPGKMDEAKQSLESVETDTSKTGKYSKKDGAKLEKADEEVKQAEGKLGISGEPAKKPGVFRRIKDWIVSKVINIKDRIKKVAQAAKAKLVSVGMDVMGVSTQFEDLKGTAAEDRQSNVETMEAAGESSQAAEDAEEKAEEFASSL